MVKGLVVCASGMVISSVEGHTVSVSCVKGGSTIILQNTS